LVHIGALFAVDLDADKMVVEKRGDGGRLERFVFHHMAPVAGRVTDREEDRLVLRARLGEGLLVPGKPVDGIIGVLKQVGRFFAGETVGVRRRLGRHR
jgi:hypothetical protein